MGNFRITISGVGGHGVDRGKGHGETVDFAAGGDSTPDAIAKRLVDELVASGAQVSEATVHHWPGQDSQVVDSLLSGRRCGSF